MFGNRRVERRLRAERPAPEEAFARGLEARVREGSRRSRTSPSIRLGVALAVALVCVIASGTTGGLGYAADAISQSSHSVAGAIDHTFSSNLSLSSSSNSPNSDNVVAATAEYGGAGWYCFQHGNNGSYTKVDIASSSDFSKTVGNGNGWNIVWGPQADENYAPCGTT